ncbi:MAG: hypothetical protein EOO02_20080 [Chitinophagaceae bacterium]|nr:MAG: hypothetical protein EOO02_20080 [Chitinophagaceae bacterium]
MKSKDQLSRFWFIVSNALPPVGFFLYFRHWKESPLKARRALTSAAIGVPIAIIGDYVFNNVMVCQS